MPNDLSAAQPDRPAPRRTFDEVFARADRIEGWLTRAQAELLWQEARRLPNGARVAEIGSHLGRSAVVLAGALEGTGSLTAVDPFEEGWRYGHADTERRFRVALEEAGLAETVRIEVARSRDVRRRWQGRLDLVYVDGKHDHWTVRDDLGWSDPLTPGGLLLLHDCFSSLGVTTAVLRDVLPGRTLAYRGRVGSLAVFQRSSPTAADRLLLVRELPWFARNLVLKVLLRLRLGRLAARLGHHGSADPY